MHSNSIPSYDPFVGNNSYENRFLFTGREFLRDVGLYDYRNRIYSPSLGRFLQTDPLSFSAGDVNLYRYCGNRPTCANDPMGLKTIGTPQPRDLIQEHVSKIKGQNYIEEAKARQNTSYYAQVAAAQDRATYAGAVSCRGRGLGGNVGLGKPEADGNVSLQDIIDGGIQAFREGGSDSLLEYYENNTRYVDYPGLGTIDLQHVSGAAYFSQEYFSGAGQIAGLYYEIKQVVQGYFLYAFSERGPSLRESAWSRSDFTSNAMGDFYGSTGKIPQGM